MDVHSLPVDMSLLFNLYVRVKHEHLLGDCPSGERRLYFGATGRFEGPGLKGELIDGGDWLTVRKDGAIVQDVGFLLRTHDGASIAYRHRGVRHEGFSAANNRPPFEDPATQYFMTTPQFETMDGRYDWLNRIIAIGRGKKEQLTLQYSVYVVHPKSD